jgi:hypothetical protein
VAVPPAPASPRTRSCATTRSGSPRCWRRREPERSAPAPSFAGLPGSRGARPRTLASTRPSGSCPPKDAPALARGGLRGRPSSFRVVAVGGGWNCPLTENYRMKCAAPARCRTLTRSDYADY